MDITVTIKGDYGILHLSGQLDATQAGKLNEAVEKLLAEGPPGLIIDCEKLKYVASAGLRCFLKANSLTSARGGKLMFCSLNDTVRDVFAVSGFLAAMNVSDTLADAEGGF